MDGQQDDGEQTALREKLECRIYVRTTWLCCRWVILLTTQLAVMFVSRVPLLAVNKFGSTRSVAVTFAKALVVYSCL